MCKKQKYETEISNLTSQVESLTDQTKQFERQTIQDQYKMESL